MTLDQFSKLAIQLYFESPFWAFPLQQLERRLHFEVPAISLTHRELLIPAQVQLDSRSTAEWLEELKHEILHFIFQHPIQKAAFPEKVLYDLSADLTIDQYLGMIPPELSEVLPPFQSTALCYNFLKEKKAKQENLVAHITAFYHKKINKHQLWKQAPRPPEQHPATHWLEYALSQSGESLPESLKEALSEQIHRYNAHLDWKAALRQMAARSQKTYLYPSRHKPSRRYGRPPGNKIRKKLRLLIALDTSGSISNTAVHRFFSAIHEIYRHGSELDIIECDLTIQRCYSYNGRLPTFVEGRGGTNFNPPIQFLNQHKSYGGMVYFTDAKGLKPLLRPEKPLLWVVYNGKKREELRGWPGRKVFFS